MKQSRTAQKLALRKDTLRVLDQLDLSEIAAGLPTTTVLPTRGLCPSVHIICDTTINQTV
jgi:hypothetical protein